MSQFAEKKPEPDLPELTLEEQINSTTLDELEEYEVDQVPIISVFLMCVL